jgi:putative DNA primase/helicase
MHNLSTTEQRFRDSIPDELATGHDWVAWKAVRKLGEAKLDKKPVKPDPLEFAYASHSDPTTWGTLEWAWQAKEAHDLDGVGKVFHDDNDLIGIDLDKCRDKESGKVTMWVLNIVSKLDTYAEVSPSGTGIKLWLYGILPGARRRNDAQGVEMYDDKRFFTVTGCRLPDAPRRVNRPDPEILDALYYAFFPEDKAASRPQQQQSPPIEDERVLARLRSDEGAAKFASVYYDGDLSAFDNNWSKADWYLASRIAFYTQDAEQVERIFDGSALARRDKWTERPDYRDRTIRGAIADLTETYSPSGNGHGSGRLGLDTLVDRMAAQERGRMCYSMGGWQRYEDGVWYPVENPYQIPYRVVREAKVDGVAYSWSAVSQVHNGAREELAIPSDVWDRQAHKLAFTNGTLDLGTFKLESHRPEDYITSGVPYAYKPEAKGPNWDRYLAYLRDQLGEDVVGFLLEFLGYSLTADTSEEAMLFLVGEKGSGKSTFIEGAQAMLGSDLVMTQSIAGLQQRFGRAGLVGKRLILSREMSALKLLETDIISNIVSGEPVNIEHKGRDGYVYTPVAKVIQAANRLPRVPNTEAGIYRRLKVIQYRPLEGKPDRALKEGIKGEGPHILNTALAGLGRYKERGGFEIPEGVEAASRAWYSENDVIGMFFEDCIQDGALDVRLARVHDLYQRWCHQRNYKAVAYNGFAKQAQEVPFYKAHRGKTDNVAMVRDMDLTDEGITINASGYNAAINYAEL